MEDPGDQFNKKQNKLKTDTFFFTGWGDYGNCHVCKKKE